MKKLLLITLMIGLYSIQLHAQDYNSYLNKAYAALEEGKADVAQANYNVYVKMTDKTDPDFELLLKDLKESGVNKEDWKKDCTIIKLNATTSIAVQPLKNEHKEVTRDAAIAIASASRLGGFLDWRLPSCAELKAILPNLPKETQSQRAFWFNREKINDRFYNILFSDDYSIYDFSNTSTTTYTCIIVRTFNPNQSEKTSDKYIKNSNSYTSPIM